MKKIIFIAALFAAFISSAFATPNKPFTSGIMVTEATEFARGDNAPDFNDLMGYRVDLGVSYNAMIGIIPSLYIHPALGISLRLSSESENKGSSGGFNMSVSTSDDKSVASLDLLLPVMARYYISDIFFAELGLEFDFNILESFNTGSQKEDEMYEDMYEPRFLNLGITGGLGVTLNFGLEINLNYTHGLTDLYKEKNMGIFGKSESWSYSRINFNIAYWFGYRN